MTIAIPVWSMVAAGAAVYFACSVLAYGSTLACMQRKYPDLAEQQYRSDQCFAAFVSIFGPIGLAVSFIRNRPFSGFVFWRASPPREFLKPLKKKWW